MAACWILQHSFPPLKVGETFIARTAAQFADMFGEAIARSCGLAPGWFIATFKGKQKVAVRNGVAGEPFCGVLTALLLERPDGFVGTFAELQIAVALRPRVGSGCFPETGQAFAGFARRMAPTLRLMGIGLTKVGERSSREAIWELKAIPQAK